MYSAAIIVYAHNTLPKILNFFIVPRIERVIDVEVSGDDFIISIINCPYSGLKSENKRIGKALRKLCYRNGIGFIVPKYNKCCTENEYADIEDGLERGNTNEIKAIKNLSVLIKLSEEKNANLLKKNMGFIYESLNYDMLSTVSEEAASILIYDHDKIDAEFKSKVFEMLMAEKGISSVFTKKLGRIIRECEILYVDESIALNEYKSELEGKLIIGNNPIEGDFIKIHDVLLWFEELENFTQDNPYVGYNDEILAILRHFYKDKNRIGFIRRFPHIYMSSVWHSKA